MKDEVLQRIMLIISNYGLSKSAFSNKVEMEQTTVNNQILGKRSISVYLILNTLKSFKDISAEWLMRGEGDMFRHAGQHVGDIISSTAVVNHGDGNSIANNDTTTLQSKYLELLAKKDQQIDRLLSIIEKLSK